MRRLWLPGDPVEGSPGPFGEDVRFVPGAGVPEGFYLQGVTPATNDPWAKPIADGPTQQWLPLTGPGAGPDPGYPHWQALRDGDEFTHYVGYKSPNGTKNEIVKITDINFAAWSGFKIHYRACCLGSAPPAGLRLGFQMNTLDAESLSTLSRNMNTGAYLLTTSWADYTDTFNDDGGGSSLGYTSLKLIGQFPAGFVGYMCVTKVRVEQIP